MSAALYAQLLIPPQMGTYAQTARGAVWVLYVEATLDLVGAVVLWYGAGWLSVLFVRDEDARAPRLSQANIVQAGLGLLGIYFLLRVIPDLFEQAAWMLDKNNPRLAAAPIAVKMQLIASLVVFALAFYLAFKNLGWRRLFNAGRNDGDVSAED